MYQHSVIKGREPNGNKTTSRSDATPRLQNNGGHFLTTTLTCSSALKYDKNSFDPLMCTSKGLGKEINRNKREHET